MICKSTKGSGHARSKAFFQYLLALSGMLAQCNCGDVIVLQKDERGDNGLPAAIPKVDLLVR